MSLIPLALLTLLIAIPLQLAVFAALDRRARAARLARSAGRGPLLARPAAPSPGRRLGEALLRLAARTSERFVVLRGGDAEMTSVQLRAAGFRNRDAVLVHAFLKLVLPLAAGAVTLAWLHLRDGGAPALLVQVIWTCGLALAGSRGPDMVLAQLVKRRLARVRKDFPDMLELLVIASEAGLGPGPALQRVARELRPACPALSLELEQLVIELGVLPRRAEAWANFERRLPLPEIAVFTNTLLQAERYGTPFAGALRTLMRDERASRLLRVEEQAAKAPALMTVPLILFIMPALFIVLVGPAALSILDNIMNGGFGQ
ncbi:type II secretion system F family protein [Oceanicola sp. S124]|uniref:type II secretion system F family protein n=1 Tax=Oceanicola sp. S124 TaxID=1042378 RepID=UPI0002558613|nr:type II secretion system F family protein [Oceanicola sp. S124]